MIWHLLLRRVSDEDLERLHRQANWAQTRLITLAAVIAVMTLYFRWPKVVALLALPVALSGLAANTTCTACRSAEWHRGWDVPMRRPGDA